MLQSFRGTVDGGGIRSLYLEADVPARPQLGSSVAEFWAVLDAKELPVIREAVRAGDRRITRLGHITLGVYGGLQG